MGIFGRDNDHHDEHELVRMLGNLILDKVTGHSKTPPPQAARNEHGGFVGGFSSEHRRASQDDGPSLHKPLPPVPYGAAAPPPFPSPSDTRLGPPSMFMPDPQPGWAPTTSLTTQFAQSLWNGTQGQQSQPGALGPPMPDLPYRPHSDPAASESISTPIAPGTPKRPKPGPVQAPASVPSKVARRQSSSAAVPAKPTRKRSASVSDMSPSTVLLAAGSYQCSGLTLAGERCRKTVKVSAVLMASYGDDEIEEAAAVYCKQHNQKMFERKEFISPVKNDFVDYKEYIPDYLDPTTQLTLRDLMTKPASKSDTDGYIYCFEIRDDSDKSTVLLKVGRTVSLNKRMEEWGSQCKSKSQYLRGYWPGNTEGAQPDAMNRMKQGRAGKFCHRLERLIHVELRDLVQNRQYLEKTFPDVRIEGDKSKAESRKPCEDCGKCHKEIFVFERAGKGSEFHKQEWEKIVKPLILKWGKFVETHVIQEAAKQVQSED